MDSIWTEGAAGAPTAPALSGDIEADTVVVGGGITGLTTAWRLAEAGQRVVLLEADTVGSRNTGGSTGNLYATVSGGLGPLRDKWGADTVRCVARLRAGAMDRVEQAAARFNIDCGFARRPLVTGVAGDAHDPLSKLEADFDACAEAGLAPRWLDTVPALPYHRAYVIEGQAQFDPYAYVRGLVSPVAAQGVRVHEHSPVVELDASEGLARTARGSVRARDIVLATHSPIGFNLVQAEMEPYREYGLAVPMSGAPEGIYWVRDRVRSYRSARHGGREYLVVVGEKHKTGHREHGVDYLQRLRDDARELFGATEAGFGWSAQQFKSADGLPYIGRSAHDNVHIATGFAADGLAWGTVAADIIAGLILEREVEGTDLLKARRVTPVKSMDVWIKENTAVVKHLVGDRTRDLPDAGVEAVPPGEGRILELDGRACAVHRSDDGQVHVLSPVCPHLKCHVAWNGQAKTWDCPCHGSRFRADGEVLEGPALRSLERVEPHAQAGS